MNKRRSHKLAPPSKPPKALCQKVTMLVADYVSRDLDRSTRAMFTKHIGKCRECSSFLNTYRLTLQATHNLAFDKLPPDLQAQILSFMRRKLGKSSGK